MKILNKLTPQDWRRRHPKCKFCKHCKLQTPSAKYGVSCPDFFSCEAKDKIITFIGLPRRFCRCFEVKE